MARHRNLGHAGGFSRKTISLPLDMVEQVEEFLDANQGMTFSAFAQDALAARLELFGIKKRR